MKVRNGFVSNSSSSSFILVFDKKPETKEELASLMGDCSASSYGDSFMSADMVVDIAFNDISCSSEASKQDIQNELSNHHYKWTNLSWGTPEYKKWQEEEEERIAKLTEQYIKSRKGKYITIVSYADEDGSIGSMMEHGDIFRNLNDFTQVSHH